MWDVLQERVVCIIAICNIGCAQDGLVVHITSLCVVKVYSYLAEVPASARVTSQLTSNHQVAGQAVRSH